MLTEEQIQFLNNICNTRYDWSTTPDNSINIDDFVYINNTNISYFPVKFGKINGEFDCSNNKLTTLIGSPTKIKGYYSCDSNKLENLIGAPYIVADNFYCRSNKLTSLEGCPRFIDSFWCNKNPDLKYLWGIGRVKKSICYDNGNEINDWIIACARKGIIFPFYTLEENVQWIKDVGAYSCLLNAPNKILKYFSKYIIKCLVLKIPC